MTFSGVKDLHLGYQRVTWKKLVGGGNSKFFWIFTPMNPFWRRIFGENGLVKNHQLDVVLDLFQKTLPQGRNYMHNPLTGATLTRPVYQGQPLHRQKNSLLLHSFTQLPLALGRLSCPPTAPDARQYACAFFPLRSTAMPSLDCVFDRRLCPAYHAESAWQRRTRLFPHTKDCTTLEHVLQSMFTHM